MDGMMVGGMEHITVLISKDDNVESSTSSLRQISSFEIKIDKWKRGFG